MRRLFVFMVGLIGLGVVMSGCTFGSHYIKEGYIQKNYIDKVKVDKKKVVGDRNIKFYVGKVEDKRKDKYVWMKRTYFWIPVGAIHFKDICGTVRHLTERALEQTGWGVVDSRNSADFVVDTVIRDFTNHMGLLNSWYITESDICIYNNYEKRIISKHLHKKKFGFVFHPDLTGKFKFIVGDMSVQYYKALLDYFSSSAFVDAVKKAYAEMTK